VSISNHDRKILWAKSGNRCAICKAVLVAEETAHDPAAVVGDEAHIVARSPGGPRAESLDETELDSYRNLILLCKVHHKIIDDQPHEYPKERLHEIKAGHEEWVEQTLGQEGLAPVRLVAEQSLESVGLRLLLSGRAVWDIASKATSFRRGSLPNDADLEASDLADRFLDDVTEWGEISEEVAEQMSRIREAERLFSGWLLELAQRDLLVFGGLRRLRLEGGIGPPQLWWEGMFQVMRAKDLPGAEDPQRTTQQP
jgi:hypothetical protein